MQPNQPANGPSNFQLIPVHDNRGMLLCQIPMPQDWKVNNTNDPNQPYITGPGNLMVYNMPLQSFTYSTDMMMQQIAMQSKMPFRPFPDINEFIKKDVTQWTNHYGYQIVGVQECTEVARLDQWYLSQLNSSGFMDKRNFAFTVDLKKNNELTSTILIHMNLTNLQNMQSWSFYGQWLQCDANVFQQYKSQLIFSQANIQYNLQPIHQYNQNEMQKANQSWAAHNQKMQQNWNNFNAQQQNHINTSNAMNNSIMNNWQNQNAASDAMMNSWQNQNTASDRMQDGFIDAIRGETNAVNQQTGQSYKVEQGYNQYWMNNNNEYIGSNNTDFNPNNNDFFNNQNWQEIKEENK